MAFLTMLCASMFASAAPVTLDFEEGGPCSFFGTTPLANLGGVSFTGVDGDGGSILNECSNFGNQTALSGTDFYAFNSHVGSGSIVDLTFGALIGSFSIYASGGSDTPDFLVEAFSSTDVLLDSASLTASVNEWALMSVAASGIERVRLSFSGGTYECCAIFDDLTYDTDATVPEPGTIALLGIGLVGFGLKRRRQV